MSFSTRQCWGGWELLELGRDCQVPWLWRSQQLALAAGTWGCACSDEKSRSSGVCLVCSLVWLVVPAWPCCRAAVWALPIATTSQPFPGTVAAAPAAVGKLELALWPWTRLHVGVPALSPRTVLYGPNHYFPILEFFRGIGAGSTEGMTNFWDTRIWRRKEVETVLGALLAERPIPQCCSFLSWFSRCSQAAAKNPSIGP